MEYPHGWDYEWFAVDQIGQVARFTTGGVGPIPCIVLTKIAHIDDILDKLYLEPKSSQATMRTPLPFSDNFVEIAELGLFGYDWLDVHRTASRTNKYQLISLPVRPRFSSAFSDEFTKLFEIVRLKTVTFGVDAEVDIDALAECTWPQLPG